MSEFGSLNASLAKTMGTITGQPAKVLQIARPDTSQQPTQQQATPKRVTFTPKKEDQSILNQYTSNDPKAKPGQFNGVGAGIDGYLRIAKRRYVARGAYNVE